MSKPLPPTMSFDEFDEINSPRPEVTGFDVVADKFLSRRSFLRGSLAVGASAFVLGTGSLVGRDAQAAASWLTFEPVAANSKDAITVPKGFSSHIVARWGDPLWSGAPEFDHASRGDGASSAKAFGDNNDADRVKTRRGLVRYPNFLKIIDFRLDMPIRHGIGVQTAL